MTIAWQEADPGLLLALGFLVFFIFSTESFNAPGRIDQLLFSRVERVTFRAYFHPDFLFGGTCGDLGATGPFNHRLVILVMNVVLHLFSFPDRMNPKT